MLIGMMQDQHVSLIGLMKRPVHVMSFAAAGSASVATPTRRTTNAEPSERSMCIRQRAMPRPIRSLQGVTQLGLDAGETRRAPVNRTVDCTRRQVRREPGTGD